MAKGIDIYSRYQKVNNWFDVKADGVKFVYVKLSDGGGLPNGGRNPGDGFVVGAKSVGIPVGGYHYAQFAPTAEAQADFFAGVVRNLGATGLVPMLDLEAPFSPDARAKDFGIKFCRRILDKGFRPGVYMSSSFARTLRPDQWGIAGLVIWIASYGRNDGNRHALTGGYPGRLDIHQYTSAGTIRGIVGNVDVNESVTDSLFVGGGGPAPMKPSKMQEEMMAQGTAGKGQMTIPVNGARSWFCLIGGRGAKVTGRAYYIGDTPSGNMGRYLDEKAVNFDADRPGPVPLPEGVRGITFFYDATAPFAAWAA